MVKRQTRQLEGLVGLSPREGSTPSVRTNPPWWLWLMAALPVVRGFLVRGTAEPVSEEGSVGAATGFESRRTANVTSPMAKVEGERGKDRTWSLTLNEYQRNNLLWLLNACGYGHEGVPPFTCAHTGDWVGEVALMLVHPEDGVPSLGPDERANESLEDLAWDVARWAQASAVMDS